MFDTGANLPQVDHREFLLHTDKMSAGVGHGRSAKHPAPRIAPKTEMWHVFVSHRPLDVGHPVGNLPAIHLLQTLSGATRAM